jgi:GWxTD domain-containing protein
MHRTIRNFIVAGFFLSAVLISCSVSSSLNSLASSRPYDLSSTPLHVEMSAFGDDDTYCLALTVDRSELLYTRETALSNFTSSLTLRVDTSTFTYSDTLNTESPRWMDLQFTVPNSHRARSISAELTDNNRKASVRMVIEVRDYVIWDNKKEVVIHGSDLEIGADILIHSPNVDIWNVDYANPAKFLPAPPFSGAFNRLDTITTKSLGSAYTNWTVKEGCQRFSDPLSNKSFIIMGRSADFPTPLEVKDLIDATRYIATRDEYKRMQESAHPKLALDEFWLECGQSADKSRMLIEIYYDRVEEANKFFSGLQEGWRTDRGMVHIIMGVPDRVKRDSWSEYWIYGEEGSTNFISFVFRNSSHELDDNMYRLQRNIVYRTTWDRMVTSWRNGRVHRD